MDLREILRERDRPARDLLGSAWRWTVVAAALTHVTVAALLGGGGEPAYVAAAGFFLVLVSALACFSATPGRRVAFAILTFIGVAIYALGVGCPVLAGTWLGSCVGLALLRFRALDLEQERAEETDEPPETTVGGILRRRMEGRCESGGTTPPP